MKNKQTKPASLFIILTLVCLLGYSQDYLITFSGSGQSNMVESVEVKNIDQQTTLALNGLDTLHLLHNVGVGYLPSVRRGMIVYPNPANQVFRLEFYNSASGNIKIEIYDRSGRLLVMKTKHLAAGSHAFNASGINTGIYLVKATTPEHVYTQRLVSVSNVGFVPIVQYEGVVQASQHEHTTKSISNIVQLQYNDGDRLVIKAISGDYAHTKSLIPTQSQNIDFEFMDCVDFDGNHYGVVTIDEQVWMAENLKTTNYINGEPIEYPGTSDSAWINNTNGAYAWYNNDISWKASCGALYNWRAVNNANGLCPTGWHLPSDAEWSQLVDYLVFLGFPNVMYDQNGAGNALKSCRQVNSPLGGECNTTVPPRWHENSTRHGFDEFGFSGLPCGYRINNGLFGSFGGYGYWWSSTEVGSHSAWFHFLSFYYSKVYRYNDGKSLGFSIRCLRD